MSSFTVGSKHISAILTWAIDQGFLGLNSPQSWFRQFYQENLDSVNYRYRENNQIPEQAKYRPVLSVLNSRYPQEIARRFADLCYSCLNSCGVASFFSYFFCYYHCVF